LTQRERDVMALLVMGCEDKEICRRLRMAHGTLRTHLQRMFARYEVTNRTALVRKWAGLK
jgi:DNA-binding NarL/FixJ family response regulator